MTFYLNTVLIVSSLFLWANSSIAQPLSTNVSGASVNSTQSAEGYKKPDNKIDISKVKIELKKNQKSDFFTIYNRSETEAFGFTVEAFRWSQENGRNKLEKSENIVLSPKTFVIAPKQYKNIRLVAQNYQEALKDYSYRLVLTQVTRQSLEKENTNADPNKLKVNFTVTMPVFFYSQEFKEADKMNISALVDGKKLTIANNDSQHLYIKSVNFNSETYKYGWYVLPGNSISVPVGQLKENSPIEIITDRVTVIK